MPNLKGQTLKNRYRIEALLGRGGMAEVYRAFDLRRTHPVAVKVMHDDLAEDIEFFRRFARVERGLRRLTHDNIIRFYEFQRNDKFTFLVMDFVEGITLRRRIQEAAGNLPLDELLSIGKQICAALHYVHEEGILHRNVKPSNIMLPPGGRVLVTDFGIESIVYDWLDEQGLTYYGPIPAYKSPESLRRMSIDRRSDIYSLGVILYEMAAGRRPFIGDIELTDGGTNRARVRWEHLHAEPPALRAINPAVPPELEAIILKALAKNPDDRWPTALALSEALSVMPDVPVNIAPSPPVSAPPMPARKSAISTTTLVALLVALFIFGLAAGWFLMGLIENKSADDTSMLSTSTSPDVTPEAKMGSSLLAGPGYNYDIIGRILIGDRLTIVGASEDREWLKIEVNNLEGWVEQNSVRRNIPLDNIPTEKSPTRTPLPTRTPTHTPTATRRPTATLRPAATRRPTATRKPTTAPVIAVTSTPVPLSAQASPLNINWPDQMEYENKDQTSRWCQISMTYHNKSDKNYEWPDYQPLFQITNGDGTEDGWYRANYYRKENGWANGISGTPPTIIANSTADWTWYIHTEHPGQYCSAVYIEFDGWEHEATFNVQGEFTGEDVY